MGNTTHQCPDTTQLKEKLRKSEAKNTKLQTTNNKQSQELDGWRTRHGKTLTLLEEARELIVRQKTELEGELEAPVSIGTVTKLCDDKMIYVYHGGVTRRLPFSVLIDDPAAVQIGQSVALGSNFKVVEVLPFETTGPVFTVKSVIDDYRVEVSERSDEVRIVNLTETLREPKPKIGDLLRIDPKTNIALERIPKPDVESLLLEEVPDISYSDIGGLSGQIEAIRDGVELPYLHPEEYIAHDLKPLKGILLYGPPGCGKTMIGRAIANSLAKRKSVQDAKDVRPYFISIKGAELLDKYVGETERHIREVFKKAREQAESGDLVVVFFDEMDALFRVRGMGISSDIETTIVPTLLSEIDGVEKVDNVLVVGATNRHDSIDPAVLRPGRLDLKVKIDRPDAAAAREIFACYLTPNLPIHKTELDEHKGDKVACVNAMTEQIVEHMYAKTPENHYVDVTYSDGTKGQLYHKDYYSGAAIQNIVDRAKKLAIRAKLDHGQEGLTLDHLFAACAEERKEREELSNLDKRIVGFLPHGDRTSNKPTETMEPEEHRNMGQYL